MPSDALAHVHEAVEIREGETSHTQPWGRSTKGSETCPRDS